MKEGKTCWCADKIKKKTGKSAEKEKMHEPKEAEECSWSRESILTVIQKATENNEGPLDKTTIVKRCNTMFQGKRRKVTDNLAQTYLNQLVKTNQLAIVFPTQKKTPFYVLAQQAKSVSQEDTGGVPHEATKDMFVGGTNCERDETTFTRFVTIESDPITSTNDSPEQTESANVNLNLHLSLSDLLDNFSTSVENVLSHLEKRDCHNEKSLIISSDISASLAIVIAFLMKSRQQNLSQAYEAIMNSDNTFSSGGSKNTDAPNTDKKSARILSSAFIRRLLAYERTLYSFSCQNEASFWDGIQTETTNFQEWLSANNKLGKKNYEDALPTHLLWSVKTKPHYHIPLERMPEFFSEYAKAYLRGELLTVVEYRGQERSPLYLDLDIKCALNDVNSAPSKEEILVLFLDGLRAALAKFLSPTEIQSAGNEAKGTEAVEEEVKEKMIMAISGIGTKFSHSSYPRVNFKYGFHVVFPKVMVGTHQQKTFLGLLGAEFMNFWPEPDDENTQKKPHIPKGKQAIPAFIYENNRITEIFDHSENLRMLYSAKMMPCKKCKTKKQMQKKHQGKKNQGQAKKPAQECPECKGTGLRDFRVYEFLGVYSCTNKKWDKEVNQGLGDDLTGVRRKVELCSICCTRDLDFIK